MNTIAFFLVATSLFLTHPAIHSAHAQSQPTARGENAGAEIVAKYLDAVGGAESLKGVETKRILYRVHMFGRDDYIMERSWKRPNSMQTGRPGASAYMLTEGNRSWRVGAEGRRELPAALAASLAKQADIDGPLVDWAQKGISLDYLGAERYDMSDLHRVMMTFEDGVQWELDFDDRTGYLRKMKQPTFKMLNNEVSRGPDALFYYYDYRPVDGLAYPHLWLQVTEDHVHAFTVEEIELKKR